MSHYKSNLTDILFTLNEVLRSPQTYGQLTGGDIDVDQARLILEQLDDYCTRSQWSHSFADVDREKLVVDEDGDVHLPESLHDTLEGYYRSGWHLLGVDTALGGIGAPPTLLWAATELLTGSHAAAALWPIGPLMANIIHREGTEGQREHIARPMVEGPWGATMMLTEPDAGSDVGSATTRAVRSADNGPEDLGSAWHLTGVKRFITSADATPLHPNTIHLVLARPEGARKGTKGLSLFLVPKHHLPASGRSGRNGIRVTRLEDKMGLAGSATCEVTLGQDGTPCVGYLLGDVHDGIRQMFHVIEHARLLVATKAAATLSTGYLNALDYARTRQQGAPITADSPNDAPRVAIEQHPDVRRMLLDQKAYAEGMRALILYIGSIQEQELTAADDEKPLWRAREDLLLPVAKGWASEMSYQLLGSSTLQTFGGSGYTRDYPIEQYVRDAKIDTLYEGTTGIQGLDLMWRKIARDGGQAFGWLTGQMLETADACGDGAPHQQARHILKETAEELGRHVGTLAQRGLAARAGQKEELLAAALHTTSLLASFGEAVASMLLIRQADAAHHILTGAGESQGPDYPADYLEGKIVSALWFTRSTRGNARLRADRAEAEDGWAATLPVHHL